MFLYETLRLFPLKMKQRLCTLSTEANKYGGVEGATWEKL